MSDKVKLPKEVADAIEKVWTDHGKGYTKHMVLTNWTMLKEYYNEEYKEINGYAYSYPIEYMQALVNGYEVEQTPEDKVREYYKKLTKEAIQRDREKFSVNNQRNEMQGIINTLKLLDIKIEGINT